MILLLNFQFVISLGFILLSKALSFPFFPESYALPGYLMDKLEDNPPVPVPDQKFNMSGFEVNLTEITFEIKYGHWVSHYISPSTLHMVTEDPKLIFNAFWSSKHHTAPQKFPQGNGSISAVLGGPKNESALDVITHIGRSNGKIPLFTNSTCENCTSKLDIKSLHLTGNWKLFGSNLTRLINTFLVQQIPQSLCTQVRSVVDDTLSYLLSYLVEIMDALELLIPVPPSPPPHLPSDLPLVNWQKSKLLKMLNFFLDDDGQMVNLVIDCLTNDTGAIDTGTIGSISIGTNDIANYFPTLPYNISLQLNVSGLDTFYDFRLLKPITNFSLSTEIALHYLNISLDIFLPNFGVHMPIAVDLEDLLLAVDFSSGFIEGIGNLHLSQLAKKHCFESFIYTMNFTRLDIDYQSMDISSSGPGLHGILALATNEYSSMITALVKHLVTKSRLKINDIINNTLFNISSSSSVCFPAVYPSPPHIIDWQKNKLLPLLDKIINHVRLSDGQPALDTMLDIIISNMNKTAGDLYIPLNKSFSLKNYSVSLNQLRIMGLDQLRDVGLLIPKPQYALDNSLSLGVDRPFNITLAMSVVSTDFSGPVDVEISLMDFKFSAELNIQMDSGILEDLYINDTLNIHCLGTSMEKVTMDSLDINGMVMIANNKSGKNISFDVHPDHHFVTFLDIIFSNVMASALYKAPFLCQNVSVPPIPTPAPSLLDSRLAHVVGGVAVFLAVLFGGVAMLMFVYGSRHQKEREIKMEESVQSMSSKLLPISSHYNEPDDDFNQGEELALMYHPQIHYIVRFGLPVLICCNIALFLSANLFNGAAVTIEGHIGGKSIPKITIFNFSLGNSIRDMWNAEVYALSMLIAVFSGGWVYLKLILMFFSWILPPSILPIVMRERALILLDTLGKWSLIDQMVLVIMVVAFRMEILLGPVDVNVVVLPEYGFYAFLLATMVSLGSSTAILALHRHTLGKYPSHLHPGGEKEAIWNHKYFDRVDMEERGMSLISKTLIIFILILSIVFIAVGAGIPSFAFSFEGAAGVALGDKASASYSLISLGNALPSASQSPNSFGTRWIQVTYFIISLVLPLMQLISLILLWVTPLTLKTQSWLAIFCEWFHAWSCLEILISSILAALLEIETFAAFIVGGACDPFADVFQMLFGSRKCFSVGGSLDSGCWVLAVGSVTYVLASQVAMHKARQAIEERRIKQLAMG